MKKSSSSGFFDRIIKKTVREPRPSEPFIIENDAQELKKNEDISYTENSTAENDIPVSSFEPDSENFSETEDDAVFDLPIETPEEIIEKEDYPVEEESIAASEWQEESDAAMWMIKDENRDYVPNIDTSEDLEVVIADDSPSYGLPENEIEMDESSSIVGDTSISYDLMNTPGVEQGYDGMNQTMMPPADVHNVKKRRNKKSYNGFLGRKKSSDEVDDFQNSLRQQKMKSKIMKSCFFLIALFVAAFCLLPVLLTFLNSFMSEEEISINYGPVFSSVSNTGYSGDTPVFMTEQPHLKFIPEMVSINQYKKVLIESPVYLLKFWNSVYYTVIIVVLQIVVGSLAAYSFSRYRRKRREVLFFSYIILMLMPYQVTIVPNYLISRNMGILDTRSAILLPGIFSTFSVFLLTKYMRQIPSSYIEAAKLDGAGEWQIFTRIALPMAKSALYAMAILIFVDYWNMVEQPLLLLQKSEDLQPLSLFLSKINEGEVGIAFAASFIFMFPPLLIFMHGEQYLVEGISHSGLK